MVNTLFGEKKPQFYSEFMSLVYFMFSRNTKS